MEPMTAAFVLGINLFIAGIFAVAFGVVAATSRSERGAKWIACGYASGICNILLEYSMPWQTDPVPVGVAIFLTYLAAMTLCVIGVVRHYRIDPPWQAIVATWAVAILLIPFIFTLPYGTPLRVALYHLPYVAIQLAILFPLLRQGPRQKLDMLLVGVLTISACIHLSRPLISLLSGTARTAQGYITSDYAAISQSLAAGVLMAQALVMLLIMMRDIADEMQMRSETDILSGALNRRGLEARAEPLIAEALRADTPLTLVAADLDFFKQTNDGFGHAAGDAVIARFARMLRDMAPPGALVCRLGGEEFAVLLPAADLAVGRRYAEAVRLAYSAAPLLDLGIADSLSASFGAAQLASNDTLFDLLRRADTALYRAKAGGRNQVCVALNPLQPATATG